MSSSTESGRAIQGSPADRRARSAWRAVNITPAERLGRVAVGLAAIIAGLVMLTNAGPAWALLLQALLVATGLDLAITGTTGHLVATGVASPGFLAVAVGCTLMMALMMRGMSHGGGDRS